MSFGSRILFLSVLAAATGCRNQSAKEIVEAKLAETLPQHASKAEVEQYLDREHVEFFQQDHGILARFHNVKDETVCRVDVSVQFFFDPRGGFLDHKSEEMRACL